MNFMKSIFAASIVLGICLTLILSCTKKPVYGHDDGLASFSVAGLEDHIRVLASDEYEGRNPFTEGEKKTLQYLETKFKELGVEPGNGDSYRQEVPMVEITPYADSTMLVKAGRNTVTLRGLHDFTINSQRTDSLIEWRDEPMVFAGFGIVAP